MIDATVEDYRAIFESARDGLVVFDAESGEILDANRAFCSMHGYERMSGLTPTSFVHPGDRAAFFVHIERSADHPHSLRIRDLHRDGHTLDVDVRGAVFTFAGRPAMLGVVRDVTAQVRDETALARQAAERARELESLLDVARAVASTLELPSLVRLILSELRRVVDYTAASLILIEDGDLVIHDLLVSGEDGLVSEAQEGLRFPITQLASAGVGAGYRFSSADYPCVQVAASPEFWTRMQSGEAVIIDDVLRSPGALAEDYRRTMGGVLESEQFALMRSWMAVPLAVKDRIIGYIGTSSARPGYFHPKLARLAQAFADHAAVAIENARLYEHAQQLAAVDERQRLARDLHDSVAQALYGIALGANTAKRYLESDPPAALEPIDYVVSLAAAGLAEMRALIFDLRPDSVQQDGLLAAIGRQALALSARHGIDVVVPEGEEPDLPPAVKEGAYVIVREALHNVMKHAHPRQVVVRVERDERTATFEVRDDGVGFDTSSDRPGHMGLRSMEERARKLGGELFVRSQPGEGTVITAVLPLATPADARG